MTENRAENRYARSLLCADVGESTCLAECPSSDPPREHAECLLRLRFRSDPEALAFARAIYAETNALVGIDMHTSIEGYRGEDVGLRPAWPVGSARHHLRWLHGSLAAFDAFTRRIRAVAPHPVRFEPRPKAFVFFETEDTYPSAYCDGAVIAYNVRGPLHRDRREMHETLFHELFHVNDSRRGGWSERVLGPMFDTIVRRCEDDDDCFAAFAPHSSLTEGGTFYAFDPRTRDVREYGAELAVRYFLEHEAIFAGQPLPRFKCRTPENRWAWERLSAELFGDVDLTEACER